MLSFVVSGEGVVLRGGEVTFFVGAEGDGGEAIRGSGRIGVEGCSLISVDIKKV